MKRLFIGSPRQAFVSLALIGVLAAALVFVGEPAFAADPPTRPDPVTDVRIDAVGITEVTVSFVPPSAGECPVTYFYIVMRHSSGGSHATIPHRESDRERTVLTQFELSANTEYRWDIRTGSKSCSTGSTPVSITFKTKAEPSESKNPPKPPKKLAFSGSGNSVTMSWTAPNQNKKRCAISKYVMLMADRTAPLTSGFGGRGFGAAKQHIRSGTSATVPGLTSGHKYGVYLASYSDECEKYSTVVKKIYTHP